MKIFDMLNENALQLCRIAVYSNSVAKAEMFHKRLGGLILDTGKEGRDDYRIRLTTPSGTTHEDIDTENEAERLWMVVEEIVDAWDEYGKEVD